MAIAIGWGFFVPEEKAIPISGEEQIRITETHNGIWNYEDDTGIEAIVVRRGYIEITVEPLDCVTITVEDSSAKLYYEITACTSGVIRIDTCNWPNDTYIIKAKEESYQQEYEVDIIVC